MYLVVCVAARLALAWPAKTLACGRQKSGEPALEVQTLPAQREEGAQKLKQPDPRPRLPRQAVALAGKVILSLFPR